MAAVTAAELVTESLGSFPNITWLLARETIIISILFCNTAIAGCVKGFATIHIIWAALLVITCWIIGFTSCAEVGWLSRYNASQGLRFRGQRNAMWGSSPFRGAIYVSDTQLDPEQSYFSATQRDDRDVDVTVEFRPLCETMTRPLVLSNTEYEYRPPLYHEKVCRHTVAELPAVPEPQMCLFSCVQRRDTVYLTRRRYDTNCWETVTRTVSTGCDCMWQETQYSPTG